MQELSQSQQGLGSDCRHRLWLVAAGFIFQAIKINALKLKTEMARRLP
jgi:hypothetical protein